MYAYVTLTSPSSDKIPSRMKSFVDRLQSVHENLPLRTIPLEIQQYSPMKKRFKGKKMDALDNQRIAIDAWRGEIEERFSWQELSLPVTDVSLN